MMSKCRAEYYYDPGLIAVAEALAKQDGYILSPEAFSVIQSPNPWAMRYWLLAFVAVEAVNQFRESTGQEISGETL